jgi:hypothetical protein
LLVLFRSPSSPNRSRNDVSQQHKSVGGEFST